MRYKLAFPDDTPQTSQIMDLLEEILWANRRSTYLQIATGEENGRNRFQIADNFDYSTKPHR